jgi:hypothetical protein
MKSSDKTILSESEDRVEEGHNFQLPAPIPIEEMFKYY